MLKRTLLATGIFTTLVGCGGGGESSNAGDLQPSQEQILIRVSDIENAYVCVDRNADLSCQDSEFLPAPTDKTGDVLIDEADSVYNLIAMVNEGIAIDAKTGFVKNSYELIAKAGSEFINPFTTLSFLNNMTNEAVAASLNLNSGVLFSDYDASNSGAARKVQLLDRSLVSELGELNVSEAQNKLDLAIDMNEFIEQEDYNEIDSVTVVVEGDEFAFEQVSSTMEALLTSRDSWSYGNLDAEVYATEQLAKVRFFPNDYQAFAQDGSYDQSYSIGYSIDGVMSESGTDYLDKFLFIGDDLLISSIAGNNSDIKFWVPDTAVQSHVDTSLSTLPVEKFQDAQIWYYLADEGNAITVLEMTFHSDGIVDILDSESQVTSVSYSVDAQLNQLTINVIDAAEPLFITSGSSDEDLLLIKHNNRDTYGLFTQDKQLAYSLIGD